MLLIAIMIRFFVMLVHPRLYQITIISYQKFVPQVIVYSVVNFAVLADQIIQILSIHIC